MSAAEILESEVDARPDENPDLVVRSLLSGLHVFSGKWTLSILWYLEQRPRRFGELSALLRGVTAKVLTYQLRALQHTGLIESASGYERHRYYALTSAGVTAMPVVHTLRAFGEWRLRRSTALGAPRGVYQARLPESGAAQLNAMFSGWKVAILTQLQVRSRSFGALWAMLVGIQPKELVEELNRLQSLGLIEPFGAAGRVNHYRLTENGAAVAPIAQRLFQRTLAHMWLDATAEEKSTLRALVRAARVTFGASSLDT